MRILTNYRKKLRKIKLAIALFVIYKCHKNLSYISNSQRSCHRRIWNRTRLQYGAYAQLVQVLAKHDPAAFYNYVRMNENCFRYIVDQVTPVILPSIGKQRRWFHISVEERVALTLRFLATG